MFINFLKNIFIIMGKVTNSMRPPPIVKKIQHTFTNKKTWNKAGQFLEKKVAPMAIKNLKTVMTMAPGGALIAPLFDMAANSAKTGKFQKMSAKKYFQKVGWDAIGADNPAYGGIIRNIGEAALHGNKKYLQQAAAAGVTGVETALNMYNPATVVLNPFLDAASQSISNGNLKALKNLNSAKKIAQKEAWVGLSVAADNANVGFADQALRGGIESAMHGNAKHLKRRTFS